MLRRLRNPLSSSTVLDIGCGAGLYETTLAKGAFSVIGLDLSMVPLRRARRESPPNVDFVLFGGADLDFIWDCGVDLVFSMATFQHLTGSQVKRYLADSYRVLKPGGLLAFQVFERGSLLRDMPRDMLSGRVRLGLGKMLQGLLLWRDSDSLPSPSWPLGRPWLRGEIMTTLHRIGFVDVAFDVVAQEASDALMVTAQKP